MREIWKKFVEASKTSALDAWKNLKGVFKSTWELFKTVLVDFVKGIANWLTSLIKNSAVILWDLLKTVASALLAAILASIDALVTLIISWIGKL